MIDPHTKPLTTSTFLYYNEDHYDQYLLDAPHAGTKIPIELFEPSIYYVEY